MCNKTIQVKVCVVLGILETSGAKGPSYLAIDYHVDSILCLGSVNGTQPEDTTFQRFLDDRH